MPAMFPRLLRVWVDRGTQWPLRFRLWTRPSGRETCEVRSPWSQGEVWWTGYGLETVARIFKVSGASFAKFLPMNWRDIIPRTMYGLVSEVSRCLIKVIYLWGDVIILVDNSNSNNKAKSEAKSNILILEPFPGTVIIGRGTGGTGGRCPPTFFKIGKCALFLK